MKDNLLPSNFTAQPWGSVFQKSEAETIARNIMVILKRTGNTWRKLSWDEYLNERQKDDHRFTGGLEKGYFEDVVIYTTSPEKAAKFSPTWEEALKKATD